MYASAGTGQAQGQICFAAEMIGGDTSYRRFNWIVMAKPVAVWIQICAARRNLLLPGPIKQSVRTPPSAASGAAVNAQDRRFLLSLGSSAGRSWVKKNRLILSLLPQIDIRRVAYFSRFSNIFMVLPVRIELTTSPLPRECSTTELRQHNSGATTGEITLRSRRDPCHRGYAHASEPARGLRSRPLHGSWQVHGMVHVML